MNPQELAAKYHALKRQSQDARNVPEALNAMMQGSALAISNFGEVIQHACRLEIELYAVRGQLSALLDANAKLDRELIDLGAQLQARDACDLFDIVEPPEATRDRLEPATADDRGPGC